MSLLKRIGGSTPTINENGSVVAARLVLTINPTMACDEIVTGLDVIPGGGSLRASLIGLLKPSLRITYTLT